LTKYMSATMPNALTLYMDAVAQGHLAVRAIVLSGPHLGGSLCLTRTGVLAGTLGDDALDAAAQPLLLAALESQQTTRVSVESAAGSIDLLLDVTVPPPRLIVIGAVHTAIALVQFANLLGFQTVVLDARAAFATPERFGHAHALLIRWPADSLAELAPDETTYIVVLTHDAKIDDPALAYAVTTPARYIGALGSRRTHAKRLESLRALGVGEAELARIHAPIGLDLGGNKPEEIALAIMAEVVQVKNGGVRVAMP
jgi:xanthine dehydrogenase accessory factor